MKSATVIGGGISGTTASYLLSQNGWDVTLLEKNSYLGGGFKTFYYGKHPYTDGPRPLASRNEHETGIFEFVNKLVPLRRIDHGLLTFVERDGNFYSYPMHEDDIPLMPDSDQIVKELNDISQSPQQQPSNFEEFWIGRVGKTLYSKFIDNYSKKMWQIESNMELKEFKWSPKGYTLKSGSRLCTSPDFIVGYPYAYDGYDQFFQNTTKNVNVLLDSKPEIIDLEKKRIKVKDTWIDSDIIVNTISLDEFMNYQYGPLPYIGRDFIKLILPTEHVFPDSIQFIYYSGDENFTRVVEYKKLTFYESPNTLLVIEVPSSKGKLYPLPFPEPKAIAEKYMIALPKNTYTIGRLGTYTYNIDMEGIILQAFKLIEKLK